jgi:Fe-S cluster assembly iron-binding protein IscA
MAGIGWGWFFRECLEQTGQFVCPKCLAKAEYGVYVVYRCYHFDILFIPVLWGKDRYSESVYCDACDAQLPLSVLAADAPRVTPGQGGLESSEPGLSQNLGNVVTLTDAAAREILRRILCGKFGPDTVARVAPPDASGSGYRVTLDYALSDGSDWIGESHGIGILVSRRDASVLAARTIDFQEGVFCDRKSDQ